MDFQRLSNQMIDIIENPIHLCYVEPDSEDFLCWKVPIMGPPTSPYKGAALFLCIYISDDYFRYPEYYFISPIFHPGVSDNGEVKMVYLSKAVNQSPYSPNRLKICQLLTALISLLSDPFLEDFLNTEAGKMYQNDRESYNIKAGNSCKNDFANPEQQHLYFKLWFWQFGNQRKKLLNPFDHLKHLNPKFKFDNIQLEDLCYPNEMLDKYFKKYKKNACSFIPSTVIKAHQKAKQLYPLIKAAEDDLEKWIKIMMESGDIEFVENNIEYRLCNDMKNEELWKLYFLFLKEHDTINLLSLYSKYCRFFPDDTNMMEEYKEAVKKFGLSLVPWKDPFDFEIFDENAFVKKQIIKEKQPISCYFTSKNVLLQNFAFITPLINYILQFAPPEILQKLHKSCKFFFLRTPTPICYKLDIRQEYEVSSTVLFKEFSATIFDEIPENSCFKNIRISTCIFSQICSDPRIFSRFLSKIYQCDAEYISIFGQHLNKAEIMFLICSKRVIEFKFWNNMVNESCIMLENILKCTPKIIKLGLNYFECNQNTAQIISKLPFTNKIKLLVLGELSNENLEPYAFAEFVTKNVAENAKLNIKFLSNVDSNYRNNFWGILENFINTKWPQEEERPKFGNYF